MIHILDTRHLGRPGIIAATALETNDGIALFDTGPDSTFESVAANMQAAGFAPADVRHVFLSHIHLDHAGAAWRFAELDAIIYSHPKGAPHLIDPAKLIASARRIFGNAMERLWGEIKPVPAEKIKIAEDAATFRVGQYDVRALATPGHASHHNVYHWDDNLAAGDVAGVRLGDGPVIPPFVPPELHIESWLSSIQRIGDLKAARLYLPHFGMVEDRVNEHLDALEERVHLWATWFRDRIRAGCEEAELISRFGHYETQELRDSGASEDGVRNYEQADPNAMAVPAAIRYWQKYHPEMVAGAG